MFYLAFEKNPDDFLNPNYLALHPRPTHVTQKQAAEMLDLSPPTIKKLVRSGKLQLNSTGNIPIEEIDKVRSVTQ